MFQWVNFSFVSSHYSVILHPIEEKKNQNKKTWIVRSHFHVDCETNGPNLNSEMSSYRFVIGNGEFQMNIPPSAESVEVEQQLSLNANEDEQQTNEQKTLNCCPHEGSSCLSYLLQVRAAIYICLDTVDTYDWSESFIDKCDDVSCIRSIDWLIDWLINDTSILTHYLLRSHVPTWQHFPLKWVKKTKWDHKYTFPLYIGYLMSPFTYIKICF